MIKFKLENIGLVEKAEVSLNEFTLICGENNTGKTYITYSIYGFLNLWNDLIDFNIDKNIFEELDENGFCRINLNIYKDKLQNILSELSISYTQRLSSIFSVEDEWFKNSKFEVFIVETILDLNIDIEVENTFSSSKKDMLQMKKEKGSHILEVSTLSPNIKKQIPHFVLETGINRTLGDIFFKQYFKNPFIITSERTGISLFYKELDINKNVMVEHITNNKSKDIN